MKFSIMDFFSKCDQIRRKLKIWSHSLKKPLMENVIFCAVPVVHNSREIENCVCQKVGFFTISVVLFALLFKVSCLIST